MKATIKYVGKNNDELITINGHEIQYGGCDGDGYCFSHQSFICAEKLTDEEKQAVEKAR